MKVFDLATTDRDYEFAVSVAERLHILREDYEGGSLFRASTQEAEALFEGCLDMEDDSILSNFGY